MRLSHLDMHTKEAHVHSILLLEGKHGSGSVGEVIHHITSVNISKQVVLKYFSELWKYFLVILIFLPLFHPRLDLHLFVT